jgi:hypothetical protein
MDFLVNVILGSFFDDISNGLKQKLDYYFNPFRGDFRISGGKKRSSIKINLETR